MTSTMRNGQTRATNSRGFGRTEHKQKHTEDTKDVDSDVSDTGTYIIDSGEENNVSKVICHWMIYIKYGPEYIFYSVSHILGFPGIRRCPLITLA